MYAGLGDGNTALEYLRILPFKNVSSTTMYAEGNPVIESPFSAATSIHDMLLQSWGGKVRVMPAVPDEWKDAHFQNLLCEGGATVSADRSGGQLRSMSISSPNRKREIIFSMKMDKPVFAIQDEKGAASSGSLAPNADGFYQVTLPANASITAVTGTSDSAATSPVKSSTGNANIFGYNVRFDEAIAVFGRVRIQRKFKEIQRDKIQRDRQKKFKGTDKM